MINLENKYSVHVYFVYCVCVCVSKLIFSSVNASKYGNASVWQSRGDNARSQKKDMKEHGMHNTVTKHAIPSRHQRKFAYTNIFWLGSTVRVFFIILKSILIDYDVYGSNHSINSK